MADKFEDQYLDPPRAGALDWPANKAQAVTPNDGADLTNVSRALWVGSGGDLSLIFRGDTAAVTIKNVPDGFLVPFRVKRVRATGTTATDIVSLE